jgi:chromosome segregation ATPase
VFEIGKIQELNVDIQQQKNSYDKENGAVQEYLKKINASTEKAAAIEKLKLKKRVDYNTAVGEPERLKLLIEQIENQARELERDASTLSGDIRVKEEELNAVQKEKALAQQEIEGLGFKLDSFRIAIEKRKANIDDIQRAQDIER